MDWKEDCDVKARIKVQREKTFLTNYNLFQLRILWKSQNLMFSLRHNYIQLVSPQYL